MSEQAKHEYRAKRMKRYRSSRPQTIFKRRRRLSRLEAEAPVIDLDEQSMSPGHVSQNFDVSPDILAV